MSLEKSWLQIGVGVGAGGLLAFLAVALLSMATGKPANSEISLPSPSPLPLPPPASPAPVQSAALPKPNPGISSPRSQPRTEVPKSVPAPVRPVVATRGVELREFKHVLLRPASFMTLPNDRRRLGQDFTWKAEGEMQAGELLRVENSLGPPGTNTLCIVERTDGSHVLLQENSEIFRECWRLEVSPDVRQLAETRNAFAWDLYHQFQHQPGNLFFSPSSIAEALNMVLAGARTETATEISRTLKLDQGPADVHVAAADLRKLLIQPDRHRGFELLMANRAWAQQGFTIEQPYSAALLKNYGAETGLVDFVGQPDAARREINDWIAKQTKDMLPDALKPENFTPDMRLMLVNTVYFFGEWDVPFKKELTKEAPFFLAEGKQKRVPMMNRRAGLPYFHGNGMQAVSIPYGKGQLAMVLLVPDETDELDKLEASLSRQAVDDWVSQMKGHDVELALPKIDMKSHFNLKPALKSLGIERAFDPVGADLSGIHIPNPRIEGDNLFIGMAIHGAIVRVDEAGTEAAAFTAIAGMAAGIPPPPPQVRADRPFVFLIRDQLTGIILFVGRVTDPGK